MSRPLITYDQAIKAISELVRPVPRTVELPLETAFGSALAERVVATDSNPRFDNSAVDGFAIGHLDDGVAGAKLELMGSVAAGEALAMPIRRGAAVRILTGAPVPPGCFGVAMQEDVSRDGGHIVLTDGVAEGDNIRRAGSDFNVGDVLAEAGMVVDPGVAAQLAFIGALWPCVVDRPTVTVITTGDELVDPRVMPTGSQIRDTNSVMLSLQVRDATGSDALRSRVIDDRADLRTAILDAASASDLVILAGGASVGDRDYVADVVQELGEIVFHGVSMRPGKPILFGRVKDAFVFGLPGNPASAFVCFEIFVRAALRRLAGHSEAELRWSEATVGWSHKACGREDFVRVRLDGGKLIRSGNQGSYGICSLAHAHGLARFPADRDTVAGDLCRVTWLR